MPDPLSVTDSTTRPFARRLVSEIVPFSGVCRDRVGGQVLQHLLEASRVAVHALGVRRDLALECDALLAKRHLVTLGHATEEPRDRHRLAMKDGTAALEPREIQQVADDGLEAQRLLGHHPQVPIARLRRPLRRPGSASVSR